jgi:hypothetical protein
MHAFKYVRAFRNARTLQRTLPVMVPLSVVEGMREDAKAAAARQREDAMAAAAHLVKANDGRYALLEELSAIKLAKAIYEGDLARGKINARTLTEEALAEVWRSWEDLTAENKQLFCPATKQKPFSATQQLRELLRFPAVAAYLRVAEQDNGLAEGVLAKSADTMYPALCTPLHSRAAGAQVQRLPVDVFSGVGENGRIAFAALLAFGGRNVGMYQPCGKVVPVVLRVAPLRGLRATLEEITGSTKLPPIAASVELGAAGAAEPPGQVE